MLWRGGGKEKVHNADGTVADISEAKVTDANPVLPEEFLQYMMELTSP